MWFKKNKNFYKKIIDISPCVSSRTAVYPGDKPFSRDVVLDMHKGDNLTLSNVTTTVHIGAHADAPSHYHKEGAGIDQRALELYMGPCQVIEVSLRPHERIYPKHIENKKLTAERVLFKTSSFVDPNMWREDFNSLSPELVQHLVQSKVRLVGIDTPSVDPANDKVLESHNMIYKNDLAILEGLILEAVSEGSYCLVALPLKLEGLDASPVRAVLLEM